MGNLNQTTKGTEKSIKAKKDPKKPNTRLSLEDF